MNELMQLLHLEASAIDSGRMEEVLTHVTLSNSEIEHFIRFSDRGYARNLVHKDPSFEVFLMCWRSGQRSLIHDHGGSLGGVKIIRGVLTESLFDRGPNGMIKAVASAEYHAGDIQIEEISLIHQVSNLQPASQDAISLHVYVPPLTRMTIYTLYEPEARSGRPELFNFGAGI